MKKIIRNLLLFIASALSTNVIAQNWRHIPDLRNHSISAAVQKIMHNWLGSRMYHTHIGIVVRSMQTGKILYQKNGNNLFTPASVQKTLTAVAALYYLKPNFQFRTAFLSRASVVNHALQGNLYLKFSGDPDLTSRDLAKLVHQLKGLGIKRINGHVYIDATDYGTVPYPPGWIWDDLSYSYAAPLMTTIIDRNYFSLTMLAPDPGEKRPIITTNLPPGVVHFNNDLIAVSKPRANCPIRIYSNDNNQYHLRGCYYRRWQRQVRKIAIRDMPRYAHVLVRNLLRDNHIVYHGSVSFHATPRGSHVLALHESAPLSHIIKEMLKDSDNLMTNAVFKKLGETYFQSRGTWQNSLKAVKEILAGPTGINFRQALVNDGAGLSRYNLLSPMQLSKLLYFAYHNKTVSSAFINALPIAGIDGTMKYRLTDQRHGSRIHLKTGSMTGITALAGYLRTKHNGTVSFVIMVNGFVKPRKPFIRMEDDICRYLMSTVAHG